MQEIPTGSSEVMVARGLVKRYKSVTAVAGVDLSLDVGQCLALLGPNGAGKTTTVEILEGLQEPDSGSVLVFGLPLKTTRREILERVGVVLQETSLYKRYTVRETLALFASFYRRTLGIGDVLQRLALTEKADTQLRRLSGGQKQRVYLACAIIHDPELLFLDEPTTGLDPAARRATWEILQGLKRDGKSMVLTTHYMEEAAILADHVAIIDQGRIIAYGTPTELVRQYAAASVLTLEFASPASAKKSLTAKLPWFENARETPQALELALPDASSRIGEIYAAAALLNLEVGRLEVRHGTLEDVFLRLTGRSMRDA